MSAASFDDKTEDSQALTPQERQFAVLRAQGYSQVQAYRVAFDKPRTKPSACCSHASQIANRPRVYAYMKALFREAKKLDIISQGEHLKQCIDNRDLALAAENLTAAASYDRLIAQITGNIENNLTINDQRMDDTELVKRLAGIDPDLAERIQRVIDGKREFDS